jgi:hypothetical protein
MAFLCFLFFVFLGTPVPGVAGIGHSGRYPEAWQDDLLEDHPQDYESDYVQRTFHKVSSMLSA